jgi:hypothetical protein
LSRLRNDQSNVGVRDVTNEVRRIEVRKARGVTNIQEPKDGREVRGACDV